MSSPPSAPSIGRGPLVQRAAGLLAVEAVLLAGLGLLDLLALLRSDDSGPNQVDAAAAVAFAGLAVLTALVLALLAVAVHRRRGWARTPALVLQLVALPVGTDQVLSMVWLTGTLVLLLAGATAYHLLAAGPGLRAAD